MSKRVAIVQSNYIPWKGYFDLIAAVDEFILFDDVQYTNRDWRNRNLIKTPKGTEWLSIPVGADRNRLIKEVEIPESNWQAQHWKALQHNYSKAAHFHDLAPILEPLYIAQHYTKLSAANRTFIEAVCAYLGIKTKITNSWDYTIEEGKNERLANLAQQAGASVYLSGPTAKDYLDESYFNGLGIAVEWFDYNNYPEYKQLWGEFTHQVTILDLLFNCGDNARNFMKCAK